MEKFKAFESWLISKQDISRGSRVAYMEIVDKTLKVKDFENIKSPSIIQRLIAEFKTNRSFVSRPRVEKVGILASCALYLAYVTETSKNQEEVPTEKEES